MRVFEAIGVGVLVLLAALVLLFVRRAVLARGGTIEISVRLSARVPGRGWAPGFGRFLGDGLRWYRMFSFALRPRRVFDRRDLVVASRRTPDGPELLALPADSVVLCCVSGRGSIEVAVATTTLAGFLSWLEAAPPGAASRRFGALPADDQAAG